jgi:hypothetical protein
VSGNKTELPVIFSAQNIKDIANSLPEPVCERRRELLPQILHEWARTDLKRNLTLPTRQDIQKQNQRMKRIGKRAQDLFDALNATTRNDIAHQIISKGRPFPQIPQSELDELPNLEKRLEEEICFLSRLAAIASIEVGKPKPGQPRNYAAYLVLRDAASIFLWYTGMEPTRVVDRIQHIESGPFFHFASVLWPIVFKGGTYGLSSSIQNWAESRPRGSRRMANVSALIANIASRYPRVYKC